MPTPDPSSLDLEYISTHVQEALNVEDWDTVHSIWLTGSFAHPIKPIDRDGASSDSDIDVILVTHDYLDQDTPVYHGLYPADIPIRTVDGTEYGERVMDLFSGYLEPPDHNEGHYLRLYPETHQQ